MSDARSAVLAAVRGALGDVPRGERPEDRPVPRHYRRADGLDGEARRALLVGRLEAVGARVRRCSAAEVAAAVEAVLEGHGAPRLAIPHDLPVAWHPPGADLLVDRPGRPLSDGALDAADATLSGCALAVADTGTLILDAGTAQGRRVLSLLPDLLIVVVDPVQVVGTLPEALARLAATGGARRPLTLVTGPSATADIEMQRVAGVHGPRRLEVILTDAV